MFTRLIESQRTRERGLGARVVSVGAHVLVVGALAYATLDAGTAPALQPPILTTVTYLPVAPHQRPITGPSSAPPRCAGPECITFDPKIPVELPPIETPAGPLELPTSPWVPIGTGTPTGSNGSGEGDPGAVYEVVEHPAEARAGNPRPVYPSLLRSAHVEGVVSARFVVDTTGFVEPVSLQFDDGVDALFVQSVRRALLASRFTPATTQGRRVRMRVRQEFTFQLTP